MTIENANLIKEKLDVVLSAAQEYSDSAKLFDAAKDNISTLADSNIKQSEKMQKLILDCEDYLSTAKGLIDTEYTKQLETVALKAKEVMDKNGDECQKVVNSANDIQKEIENKLNEFEIRFSNFEKQNKVFSYIAMAFGSVIILLLVLGLFI